MLPAQMEPASWSPTTDPVSQGLVAGITLLVFVLLALEKAHRVLVIVGAVALMWLISYLTPFRLVSLESAAASIDWNVLFLLAGMMAIVGVLKTTGVFPWAVARLLERARGRAGAIQSLTAWLTGAVSAVADNVTTVIFVAPMALEMARRTAVPALAFLLPMVMAANIGGTATLIGDPPNIMIGSGAGLSFLAFVQNLGVPVLCMLAVLHLIARRWYRPALASPGRNAEALEEPRIADRTLLRWTLVISGLVFLGFVTHGMTGMPVAVPALIGAASILIVQDTLYLRRHRPSASERMHGMLLVIEREIEWPTLCFFAFLFIAVGASVSTGLIDTVAGVLEHLIEGGQSRLGLGPTGTLLFAALTICWVSGMLSAVIDNIPFVAVAIPVVARLAGELPGDTEVLWWALALGACLGGNASPIGASANVTVIGLAEKAGQRISFATFTRFGLTMTLATLLLASGFLAGYVILGWARTTLLGSLSALLLLGAAQWMGRKVP